MWAFGGGGLVFGFISFIVITLIPALVAAILLVRRSPWKDGPVFHQDNRRPLTWER